MMEGMKPSHFLIWAILLAPQTRALAQEEDAAGRSSSEPSSTEPGLPAAASLPLDYRTLGHRLQIAVLRGGSYDKGGLSQYYFRASIVALARVESMPSNGGKKLETKLGVFGETTLKSLDLWRRDEKSKVTGYELAVDGDSVRETVARAMLEWGVQEDEVKVVVHLEMLRRAKKFGILGEDALIGKAEYLLYPLKSGDTVNPMPRELSIFDTKGAMARLTVQFDQTVIESKAK